MEQKIYQKNGYWVLVQKATGGFYFRASTNNEEIYRLIEKELGWQGERAPAQSDLDEFAIRHNLILVSEEEVKKARREIS